MPPFVTTILEQLGGQRFMAMTGAKQFVFDNEERSVRFTIAGRSPDGARVNRVRITLMLGDTYCVATYRVRRLVCDSIDEIEGVHAGQLRHAFTRLTGLECTL